MADQINSSVLVSPQNFVALNRGDMFVPASSVNANVHLAALATPIGDGGRGAHAVPFVYFVANAYVRPTNPIGMATPDYKGA
jgi:hypothetical protein